MSKKPKKKQTAVVTPDQRSEVIRLKTEEGLTYREIAPLVGRSHMWVARVWNDYLDQMEGEDQSTVEAWRRQQLRVCAQMMAALEKDADKGKIGATRELRGWMMLEMKLKGTMKPIPVELLQGPTLKQVLDQNPSLAAAAAQGDTTAVAKLYAMLLKSEGE